MPHSPRPRVLYNAHLLKNPSTQAQISTQANIIAVRTRNFRRRRPSRYSRLYSRWSRWGLEKYQPSGKNCSSFAISCPCRAVVITSGYATDGTAKVQNYLLMFELSQLLRPPYIFLILGVVTISSATICTYTGRVWVRFNGWVYRAKEPRAFWGNVAAYFLVGLCFLGFFLFD
jgi:hypothetical protein